MRILSRYLYGMTFMLTILFCFTSSRLLAATDADQNLQELISHFIPEYKTLKIPELELSYVANFTQIQSLTGIERQWSFFDSYRRKILAIPRRQLDQENRYQRDALLYEVDINLQRLHLEHQHKLQYDQENVPTNGIVHVPNGKRWYNYYANRWTSKNMSPEALMRLGERNVTRVSSEIKAIQTKLGYQNDDAGFYRHLNDSAFFITDEAKLVTDLTAIRTSIEANLNEDFEDIDIPMVGVKPINNPDKDTPPGYYDEGVFYYNFYQKSFHMRNLAWLFIHEAVPGHHYQNAVKTNRPPIRKLFWYPGFTEGWGAYSEDLGNDLGQYQDIYQQLGKWEWDLVRSARIVMDVGLNYFGWSKLRAKKYWQSHIPNQDDIREREIDRMIRWPAQVLSNKVGESTLLKLREKREKREGKDFNLKKFHTLVLQRGSIPLSVLENIVSDSED